MQPKKIFAMLLVVTMTLICGVTSVAAQDDASAFAMAVEVDSSTALAKGPCSIKPGDTVDVSVTITANPGIFNLKFILGYDANALTLKTNDDGSVAYTGDEIFASAPAVTAPELGKVQYWFNTLDFDKASNKDGVVLKLTFTVKDTFHGATGIYVESFDSVGRKADGGFEAFEAQILDAAAENYAMATIEAHKYGDPVVAEPTCDAPGTLTYSCTIEGCTHTRVVVNAEAKGHNYVAMPEKAPTCTETGLTGGLHCSVCGHVSEAQTVVPATGHTMGDWVEDKDAGVKTQTCTVCGHTVTEELSGGLGALAITFITIGSVAVVGGGGFCLYWFVLKKKFVK